MMLNILWKLFVHLTYCYNHFKLSEKEGTMKDYKVCTYPYIPIETHDEDQSAHVQ